VESNEYIAMNRLQRVAKNTSALLAAQVLGKLLAFFYVMYTARYLGVKDFGILSLALAFSGIFKILTDLGLNSLTVRDIARDNHVVPVYLRNVSILKTILGIATFLIILIIVLLTNYPRETVLVVLIVALSNVFVALTDMTSAIFQALEKMEYISVIQVLGSTSMLLGALLAIYMKMDIYAFACLYLITSIITLSFGLTALKVKFKNIVKPINKKTQIKPDKPVMDLIKLGLPFGLSGLFIAVYYNIDTIMISLMASDPERAVGLYNAAYKIFLILLILPSVIVSSTFPMLAKTYVSSRDSIRYICERLTKYLFMFALPACIGITILGDRIVLLVYGTGFSNSGLILKILVWSFLFASIGASFGNTLNATNKEMSLTKAAGTGMILNVLLNLVFIPRYSYIGAAVVTDLTRFIVIVIEFVVLYKAGHSPGLKLLASDGSRILISSLIMGMFTWHFKDINPALLVTLSVFVYFATLYLIKGIDKPDLAIVKHLMGRQVNE